MLKKCTDRKYYYIEEAESMYAGCKILLYDLTYKRIENIKGRIYAISDSSDTTRELYKCKAELEKEGKKTMVVGTYNMGGFIGVQRFKG